MSYDWNTPYNTQYVDTSLADSAAKNAYYDALSKGSTAADALNQSKFAWQQKMDEAGQTGMWNGQYNMPTQQNFATMFGSWMPGGPQAGQQTLAGQQQQYGQAAGWSGMFGQYYAPGTAPDQGAYTLGAQNQAMQNAATVAGLTGYYQQPVLTSQQYVPARVGQLMGMGYDQTRAQQTAQSEWGSGAAQAGTVAGGMPQGVGGQTQTLAGQQQQWNQAFQEQAFRAQQAQLAQTNTQAYLQQLASLRGPADWAKYQEVLGATPGGMRDLYAAAMGQYVPGGGATTGMQPQAANLTTMQQQIAGQPVTWTGQGSVPQGQLTNPMQPQQYQMQTGQYQPAGQQPQYQMQSGPYIGSQAPAAGSMPQTSGQTWGSGIGVGQKGVTPEQQTQATGNGTNLYGGQQQQYNLPAPNQISSQAWNNFTPSQQQMMLGNYEAAGWDKGDVQALYNQSLPKYGTNNASAGTWRLH